MRLSKEVVLVQQQVARLWLAGEALARELGREFDPEDIGRELMDAVARLGKRRQTRKRKARVTTTTTS
jgi:hypothetical protein